MSKLIVEPSVTGVLVDGTAVVVPMRGAHIPLSVWVNPAAGDTVRVEYRVNPSAPWTVWENGDVTAYSDIAFGAPIADLRFTRTAGSGTTSAFGIS